MVCTCSVTGCSNYAKSGSGISFHKFPSNTFVRQQWLKAMNRENFKPSESSKICSKHFKRDDFSINFGAKKLKCNAVPSIFGPSTSLLKRQSISVLKKNETLIKPKTCDVTTSSNNHENDPLDLDSTTMPSNKFLSLRVIPEAREINSEAADPEYASIPTQQAAGSPISITSDTDSRESTGSMENILGDEKVINKPTTSINVSSKIEGTREALVPVGKNLHQYVMIPMQADEKLAAPVSLGTSTGIELSQGTTLKKYVMMPLQTANLLTLPINNTLRINNNLSINNTAPSQTFSPKRKRRNAAYMGDIQEEDFRDPKKFRIMWNMATKTVEKQRKTIKTLRTKLSRLEKRLEKLNDYSIRIIIDE